MLANYSAIITFAEVSKGDPWKSEKGKGLDLGTFQRQAEQLSEKNLEISFGKKMFIRARMERSTRLWHWSRISQ